MTSHEFFKELGYIDPKMIEAAAPGEKRTRRTAWIKWVSVAACFVLLVSASLWLIAPDEGAYEQVEITTLIRLDERYYASYIRVNEMSNYERLTLEGKIGDLYLETETQSLYKIKGHDDIAELIAVTDEGEVELFRFDTMNYYDGENTQPFSLGLLLETVYGADSADAINSIRFEKEDSYRNRKEIKIKRVLVDEDEAAARFFEAISMSQGAEYSGKSVYISQHSEEYLNGMLPLSAQVERKVTIRFRNNTEIELKFDPYNKCVWLSNSMVFPLSEQDVAWLIELSEINMQHVDYGIGNDKVNEGFGEVTETPRPAFDPPTSEGVLSVSASSLPEGYDYFFTGEDARKVVDYFSEAQFTSDYRDNPKELTGMMWVITIAYDDGSTETLREISPFILTQDGMYYKYVQGMGFDAVLEELICQDE